MLSVDLVPFAREIKTDCPRGQPPPVILVVSDWNTAWCVQRAATDSVTLSLLLANWFSLFQIQSISSSQNRLQPFLVSDFFLFTFPSRQGLTGVVGTLNWHEVTPSTLLTQRLRETTLVHNHFLRHALQCFSFLSLLSQLRWSFVLNSRKCRDKRRHDLAFKLVCKPH